MNDDKTYWLEEIADIQQKTEISGRDLACLLGITECYITIMRRKNYISNNMVMKIKPVVELLKSKQKTEPKPLFRKLFGESASEYKKRRMCIIRVLRQQIQLKD
jgi:hypothetical protein